MTKINIGDLASLDDNIKVIRKAFDEVPDGKWEAFGAALDRLHQLARSRAERAHITDLRNELAEKRRNLFRERFEQRQSDLRAGKILDNSKLNEVLIELNSLAEPNTDEFNKSIEQFKAEFHRYIRVAALRENVKKRIQQYESAIQAGEDLKSAAENYLKPAESAIDKFLHEYEHDPDAIALLTDVRKVIKDANKEPLMTLAALGHFADIIAGLRDRPDSYVEVLVDEVSHNHGIRPKQEAIIWYEERAKAFALRKADEYIKEAQRKLSDGNPILAASDLENAFTLPYLPKEKLNEIEEFRTKKIEPQLARIHFARKRLEAVPHAGSVAEAKRLYAEAFSADRGWPGFKRVSESYLIEEAENYIYRAIENNIISKLGHLQNPTQGHYLLNVLNDSDLQTVFEDAQWGDGRLNTKYASQLSKLRQTYSQQQQERNAIRQVEADARAALLRGDPRYAYDILRPYEVVLEADRDVYRSVYQLWVDAQATYQIAALRDKLRNRIDQPRQYDLKVDIRDVKTLVEAAEQAVRANPAGAADVRLQDAIGEGHQYLHLLEGLQADREERYEDAIQALEKVSNRSRFYEEAKAALDEVKRKITDDTELEEALRKATDLKNQNKWREAFDCLKPYQDRTTARKYADYRRLMGEVKQGYENELIDLINQNIASQNDDPTDLEDLDDALHEVNPNPPRNIKDRIQRGLRIQIARRDLKKATGTQDVRLWQRALHSWQDVDPAQQAPHLADVQETYARLFCLDAIEKTYSNDPNYTLEEARATIREAIEQLENLRVSGIQSRTVNIYRVYLYVRQMEIVESPEYVRNPLDAARLALQAWTDEERTTHRAGDYQNRIARTEKLAILANTLQMTLTPENDLRKWLEAIRNWQQAVGDAQPHNRGLLVWYERYIQRLREQLQRTINQTGIFWRRIEPLGKLLLLGFRDTDLPLADYQSLLLHVLHELNADMKGTTTPHDTTPQEYIAHVLRAADAFIFIANETSEGAMAADVQPLREALDRKRQAIEDIAKIVYEARGMVNTAKATGRLVDLENKVAPIVQPTGTYYAYREHILVVDLLRQIDTFESELNDLQRAATDVMDWFDQERFAELLVRVEVLLTPEAQIYRAKNMVKVTEPPTFRGKTYNNAEDVKWAVGRKVKQLQEIYAWLKSIADEHFLANLKDNPQPFAFSQTQIVDFASTEVQNRLAFLHTRARFSEALQELQKVESGGVTDENQPAQNYDAQRLSLVQSLQLLERVPVKREALLSNTALAIFNWVGQLWKAVNAALDKVETLRQEIEKRAELFEQEYKAFTDNFEAYKAGVGNRQRLAAAIETAYGRIKTQAASQSSTGDAAYYPLAPNYEGLDEFYTQFRSRR
jgi:hypothetical protein